MKPNQKRIDKELKELRAISENSRDPFEARLAQAMEHAVRWVTLDTKGWGTLKKEAEELAIILRNEAYNK